MDAIESMNLQSEVNFLRRAVLHAEATIGCAAAIVRMTGNQAEADALEFDARYLRTVRRIVASELRLKRMMSAARDAFAEIAAEMLAAHPTLPLNAGRRPAQGP